jgi:hypothetical protein
MMACDPGCPRGYVEQGKYCHAESSLTADAGVDAAAQPGLAGSGSKTPLIDPRIQWMCMKNDTGTCTTCKQDSDCPKRVCEQGFCMDCRDASQCGAADSCISNRCIPERTPSRIWTAAGGGQSSATGFKVQVSVGTPSPATNASAAGFKLNVAPGAGLF